LKRENGQDEGLFIARSVSGTNLMHFRAKGVIQQLLDCDGLKSLGCFISHFGPADPRQALIDKWLGNTHSHKLHLKRTQNFYTIYYGTSGTGCTLLKLR
jgi:hypothetical protein